MKNFFTLLFLCAVSFLASAQGDVTILYLGSSKFAVSNNLSCEAKQLRVRWVHSTAGDKDTTFSLAQGGTATLTLTGIKPASQIRAQINGSSCNSRGPVSYAVSSTLPARPYLSLQRQMKGIVLTLSSAGTVERSYDGMRFTRLGEFEKTALDDKAGQINYYRLLSGGQYSTVYRIEFAPRIYQVYNYSGQLVATTKDITRYVNGLYIIH